MPGRSSATPAATSCASPTGTSPTWWTSSRNGGTYIYSASEAYDEEQRIDHQRLVNWLTHFGLKMVGGLPGAEKGPYHASGHIDGPALEGLIDADRGRPDRFRSTPSRPEWFEQRWAKKLVKVDYGTPARL